MGKGSRPSLLSSPLPLASAAGDTADAVATSAPPTLSATWMRGPAAATAAAGKVAATKTQAGHSRAGAAAGARAAAAGQAVGGSTGEAGAPQPRKE